MELNATLMTLLNETAALFLLILVQIAGLEIFILTYSSCGASGLNFSLVLTPVELVLKSGILKVLMSSNQHYAAQMLLQDPLKCYFIV